MAEPTRGLLDTSVVIDHDVLDHAMLPDGDAARMYGRMFAAPRAAGQTSRSRLADLLIAATAAANGLPVYTRNPSDFDALKAIIKIVSI